MNNKTLIWLKNQKSLDKISNLNLDKSLFTFYIENEGNATLRNLHSEMRKSNSNKIISFSEDMSKFEILLKSNSVWTKLSYYNLIIRWMTIKNLSFGKKEWNTPPIFLSGKNKIDFNLDNDFIDFEISCEIINFYLQEDSLAKFNKEENGKLINFTDKFSFKLKDDIYFNNFIHNLKSKTVKNLKIKDFEIIEDDKLILKINNGIIYIKKSHLDIECTIFLTGHKNFELFYENKSYQTNLQSLINDIKIQVGSPKKLTKKQIFMSLLSFLAVVFLFYITFNFIFTAENSETTFKILSSSFTWTRPFIYLMISNFVISIFLSMIMTMIIQLFSGAKISFRSLFNVWLSMQLRQVAMFLTGNYFVATFLWGFYLTKTTKVKAVGFVGMVASIQMLRAVIMIPIGILFMLRGSFYYSEIYSSSTTYLETVILISLSWIGWVWVIIHNLSLSMLIILPPLHILWNRIQIQYFDKKITASALVNKLTGFEMQLRSLKASIPKMFKNHKRTLRIFLMIIVSIMIETFEFSYSLTMTEEYAINVQNVENFSQGSYYNIFAISGIRYMTSFIHQVPILNIVPGQGLFISDSALKDSTFMIVQSKHSSATETSLLEDIAEQSTLIIRLFNFYFKKIVALFVVILLVFRIMFKSFKNEGRS